MDNNPSNMRQDDQPPNYWQLPDPTQFPTSPPGSSSGGHPRYHGIRSRHGKWVSEIREPGKSTRIWLGTYPTPEMAAAAYDVAALALKGRDACLNFPDSVLPRNFPGSPSAADIRAVAANAARARVAAGGRRTVVPPPQAAGAGAGAGEGGFVDEEALFDMPNLLVDMAGGMLVSPPRMRNDDSAPDNSGGGNLWNYY